MNEKGIGELRRRFRPDKTSVTHIRGCYVNEKAEIVSEFTQALGLMTEDEAEKILALFAAQGPLAAWERTWWIFPSPQPRSRIARSIGF